MADPSYILFNKTLEQARRLGARGGRAYACNQRARKARMPPPLPRVPLCPSPRETTAEAIAVLDAQFPWLRDAGKRTSGSQPTSAPTVGQDGKPRLEYVPTENSQRLLAARGAKSFRQDTVWGPRRAHRRPRRSEIRDSQTPPLLTEGSEVLKAPIGDRPTRISILYGPLRADRNVDIFDWVSTRNDQLRQHQRPCYGPDGRCGCGRCRHRASNRN
jgi:hypothetical protein